MLKIEEKSAKDTHAQQYIGLERLSGNSLFVFLCYFILSAIYTYPLILDISRRTLGGIFDVWNNLWLCSYFKDAIFSGKFSLYTKDVFYPIGIDVLRTYIYFFIPLVSVFLQTLFDLTTSYNLIILLIPALTAFCGNRLLHHFTRDNLASFAGGTLFVCNSYVYVQLSASSLEVADIHWIPLYILYLIRVREEGRWRDIFLSCLLFGLTTYTYGLYGAYLGIFTVVYLLFNLKREDRRIDWPVVCRLLLICSLCAALAFPMASLVGREHHEFVKPVKKIDIGTVSSGGLARLRDYFRGRRSPLELTEEDKEVLSLSSLIGNSYDLKFLLERMPSQDAVNSVRFSPGMILMILAVWGAVRMGKKSAFWLFTAVFFFFLSLGPFLKISANILLVDGRFPIPLPYYLLYNHVPFFPVTFKPHRLMIMAMVCLCVLASFGIARMLESRKVRTFSRAGAALFLMAAIAGEMFFLSPVKYPNPTVSTAASGLYREIAREQGEFAIIGIPFFSHPGVSYGYENAREFYLQRVHHKKVFNFPGMRAGTWEQYRKFIKDNSLMRYLLALHLDPSPRHLDVSGEDVEYLRSLNFRFLIIHTRLEGAPLSSIDKNLDIAPESLEFLEDLFGPPKIYPDGTLLFRMDGKKTR